MTTSGDKHQENTAKIRWGAHFKATREGMHLSEKDAASRLHLNPHMITVIESESFKSDTPVIFMRGYVRSYGKLLNMSDKHINQALVDLGLTDQSTVKATPLRTRKVIEHTNSNTFTRFSTSLVVLVLLGLVGMWWNTHTHNVADTPTTSPLNMQAANPENVTTTNATPGDPTPKELAQSTEPAAAPAPAETQTASSDAAKSAVNNPTPAAAAVAENNNGMTGTVLPVTQPKQANDQKQNANPIAANNAPNPPSPFDLPNDANTENTMAAGSQPTPGAPGTINSDQIGGLLDPNQSGATATADAQPVKKHKIHHRSEQELAGEDMALPEPGLVSEPGDMDPSEN
jgi:cytoskeleton protein RodZ